MRRTRSIFAAILLVIGVETALWAPTERHAEARAVAAGELTWSDEFAGRAGAPVDPARWTFETGQPGVANRERQYYTDRTRNAFLDGQGHLVITAYRENAGLMCDYGPCEYTSARLVTTYTFTQKYGRFEARMKIPRGQGLWPAFWLLGADYATAGWPGSGEIDVMEAIGRRPKDVHGTVHGPGYSGADGVMRTLQAGADLADDFHTYRVDWGPGLIIWYLDGHEYFRVTPTSVGGRWVFDHPFFLLLNLAVGGTWPGNPDGRTTFPQRLVVDYVRAWAYSAVPAPSPGTLPPDSVARRFPRVF